MGIYLDVTNELALGKAFLIAADSRYGLLSNVAISAIGICLGGVLCDHLVFVGKSKELARLQNFSIARISIQRLSINKLTQSNRS